MTGGWHPGSVIADRYEVHAVRGGGQARLVDAVDLRHHRRVALKVTTMAEDADRSQVFREAGVLLAMTPHPALPVAREDFFHGHDYVIAMDWVDGQDLASALAEGPLDASAALVIATQVADALDHLHAQTPPVIHGDVKPANVMMTPAGRAVLVDLGLVGAGPRSGSHGFVAPEVGAGRIPTPEADVFGFASLVFTLMAGAPPTGGTPDRLQGLDEDQTRLFLEVLRRGLATDPRRRPVSASALLGDLIEAVAPALPDGTATFLLTDIAGSTQLWEGQAPAMARLLAAHDELVHTVASTHRGRLLKAKGEGDSTVSVFGSAQDATAAAVRLQRELAHLGPAAGLALTVRMALHTGPAEQRGGDYFGPTLNRAARLRAIAHGGQVVLSAATRTLLGDDLPPGVELRDLGRHRLRDLSRPEQVFQVVHAGLRSEFPPLASLPTRLTNLPSVATTFVGREAELARISELLGLSRLVTLTGAGGSGKTRLALQTATDVLERFPDGVWLVDLAPISDPALVANATAEAIGLKGNPVGDLTQAIVRAMERHTALVVVDNCEHLIDAAAALIEAVITGCPHVRILATSRERLRVAGEATWPVPVLGLPAVGEDPVESEAVRLFFDRAAAAGARLGLDEPTASAVAEVCRRVDGIPLAIELAAARANVLAPSELLRRLDVRLSVLTSGSRGGLARHQSVRAMIEWSHSMLSPMEAQVFRRLAVFRGGWTIDGAERVAGFDGVNVLDGMIGLVEKSLVGVHDSVAGTRYRMLETIREFALEQLGGAGEVDDLRFRHAVEMRRVAEEWTGRLHSGADMIDLLVTADAEIDNIRDAVTWAIDHDPEVAAATMAAANDYFVLRGRRVEALSMAMALLPRMDELTPPTVARFGAKAGGLIAYASDPVAGIRLVETALAAAREALIPEAEVDALTILGLASRLTGDRGGAERHFRSALAVADENGLAYHQGPSRAAVSWVTQDDDEARTLLADALVRARSTGNLHNEMQILDTYTWRFPKDADSEARLVREIELCEILGDVQYDIEARRTLAYRDVCRGVRPNRALAELARLVRRAETMGHLRLLATARAFLANAYRLMGDVAEAGAVLDLVDDGVPLARTVRLLVARDAGDPTGAAAAARKAVALLPTSVWTRPAAVAEVLGLLTTFDAADPIADPAATARCYWSQRASRETGTDWDNTLCYGEWARTPTLLGRRLSDRDVAEAEGRAVAPGEALVRWLPDVADALGIAPAAG